MSQNNLTRVEPSASLVSIENTGLMKESRFREELMKLRVDCVNQAFKKIMAFNRMTDRETMQHHLYDEDVIFSYISDIDPRLLADNNIYLGNTAQTHLIRGTIYVVIDSTVRDIEDHMSRYMIKDELVRVYINISDFLAYSTVAEYFREHYANAEIISINEAPGLFKNDKHYIYNVPKIFLPWEQALPGEDQDGKIPFLSFSKDNADTIPPYYTCLYALMKGNKVQVDRSMMEQVGFSAASLLLKWDASIKTITEHCHCCYEVSNYLVFYKHFTTFGGFIKHVTLDIKYEADILGRDQPELIYRKGVHGLDISEPANSDVEEAIAKNVKYSREKLFVLNENGVYKVCYVLSVVPNIYLRIQDKAYIGGMIDDMLIDNPDSLVLITPFHGDLYLHGMKSEILKAPQLLLEFIKRASGYGDGWWAPFNREHQIILEELLKFYTLDKLKRLGIYTPLNGFTANAYSLDIKHTRWF